MTSAVGYNSSLQFGLLVAAVLAIVMLVQYGKRVSRLPIVTQRQEMTHVVAWVLFFGLTGAGLLLSPPSPSGDPSVLLTVGAGLALFSAVLQWILPPRVQTPAPYSHRPGDFALLVAIALVLRLGSTLRFQGYLPTDATGDGCYQLLEGLTLLVTLTGLRGLTSRGVVRALVLLFLSTAAAMWCYGDLDNDVVADQLFAASVYAELAAWVLLAGVTASAAARRRFCGGFLVPAFFQAAARTHFWVLAHAEILPLKPVLGMAAFPAVIVAVTATQAGLAAIAGLMLLRPKGASLVPAIEGSLPALKQAKADGSPAGFRPGRAVFEDGVLKVEYIAV